MWWYRHVFYGYKQGAQPWFWYRYWYQCIPDDNNDNINNDNSNDYPKSSDCRHTLTNVAVAQHLQEARLLAA